MWAPGHESPRIDLRLGQGKRHGGEDRGWQSTWTGPFDIMGEVGDETWEG